MKAKILKFEMVRDRVIISIIKAGYFFDVIAEGSIEDLNTLKSHLNLDTIVIEKGIFGKPVIVMDTCDEFTFAKQLMKDIIWKINKEIKEWK